MEERENDFNTCEFMEKNYKNFKCGKIVKKDSIFKKQIFLKRKHRKI